MDREQPVNTNMFTDVNEKVGTIAAEVGQTPSGWNGGVYQMIRGLSENVIVPIAGIIITFVLCYELISMITEKNNLHDMDTWMFFKWFFKAAVAIYLVTHTFDIVMAVFDIGQNVVSGAAGVIHGNTSIDIDSTIAQMRTGMENMGVGELLGLSIETLLISLCLKIMAILITVILYGRMIEIYCTVSIAPIPIATMSNREWGSIGTNYLKGLFALAFQGFLIMVCVGIYAVLINGMIIADNIHSALFSVAALLSERRKQTMAFVPVPKDLNRVKTKVMFNLTKRQLICFSIAAAVGVPIFFLTKAHLGLSTAAMLMVVIMLPFIFFALYEKDGQPAEKSICTTSYSPCSSGQGASLSHKQSLR